MLVHNFHYIFNLIIFHYLFDRIVFLSQRDDDSDIDLIKGVKENSKILHAIAKILQMNDHEAMEVAIGGAWIDIDDLKRE